MGFSSFLFGNGVANLELLKKHLPSDPIILEAGSHNGKDTIRLAQGWPNGHTFGFEPVPDIFQQLMEKVRGIENITIFQLALSEKVGTSLLNVSSSEGTGSSSLLNPKDHLQVFHWISFPSKLEVKTTTIDQWMIENGIERIDFLWLDLQGLEYHVLKASPKALKTVRVIVTEVNFRELYQSGALYPVYKKWLESQGFDLLLLDKVHASWGDAVFVRNREV